MNQQIIKIKGIWESPQTDFNIKYDERVECNILVDLDDIYTALDETLAEINMILGSRFVKPLRKKAEEWKKHIMTMGDLIDQWVMCQNQWRYLKKIFEAKEISSHLAEETRSYG